MAGTEPLLIENSVAGWVKATLRIFIRAPIFFTVLPLLQYAPGPLIAALGVMATTAVLTALTAVAYHELAPPEPTAAAAVFD